MSDRTPETDAFIERNMAHGPTGWEWRVHSRRLERERDEAREQLADWENAAAHFEADRAALHDLVRQAGEEYFRKWPADKDRIGQRLAFQDAVMQEIDLRTLDFERMKQERDEARRERDALIAGVRRLKECTETFEMGQADAALFALLPENVLAERNRKEVAK